MSINKDPYDGLVLRDVGEWSKHKHYYLENYIKIFTQTMKEKWTLCYIDLFSGPGKCLVRDSGEVIDGSPLIALRFPFAKYIFVELDKNVQTALQSRCKNNQNSKNITFLQGNCNDIANDIVKHIPDKCLSLAFIDPTGLDINFSTLKAVTQRKRMDLIINFPEGTAIKRNLTRFLKASDCPLDTFIGDKGWRNIFKSQALPNEAKATREIMEYYRAKLNKIGYQGTKIGDEVPIRSTGKNLPLYLLLFASKDLLGDKFWKIGGAIDHSGQRKLPL